MKEKLMRFFAGRYGMDSLGYAIIIFSLALSLASSLTAAVWGTASTVMWIASYVFLAWELFRMLSRNASARMRENKVFFDRWKPVKRWFKLQYSRLRDIRTHRYFVCPNCKNNLRVPKGRGEITVTCPVCKTKFDRKS